GGYAVVDVIEDAHTTAAYSYTDFERPPVIPLPDPDERTPDDDSNGFYDRLELDLELDLLAPDTYQIRGSLTDASGTVIEQQDFYLSLAAGVVTIPFAFDGETIRQHGV